MNNIGGFSMSFNGTVSDEFLSVIAPADVTYDLIISGNGRLAKAIVESMTDMQRLADGEAVEVNWYRLVNDEWEFVERRPLKINKVE